MGESVAQLLEERIRVAAAEDTGFAILVSYEPGSDTTVSMPPWLKIYAAVFSGTKILEPFEITPCDPKRLFPRPLLVDFRMPGATTVCSSK